MSRWVRRAVLSGFLTLAGAAIGSAQTAPADVAPPAAQRYVCTGQTVGAGPLPPFAVALVVDAQGSVVSQTATWTLSRPDLLHSPAVGFDFAMAGGRVTPGARDARVLAFVALQPPPTAMSAEVLLLLGGVEIARQAWQGYTRTPETPPDAQGRRPRAFSGVIPFEAPEGVGQAGLRRLLASVGQQPGSLEVKVVGDDGSVIGDATYELAPSPIGDKATVGTTLAQAQAAAKSPATECRPLTE
jgi:hypothetical protein